LPHLQICKTDGIQDLLTRDLAREQDLFPKLESIRFGGNYTKYNWSFISNDTIASILQSRSGSRNCNQQHQ
ncbi:hypothetical protein BGZ83_000825, partial [Gryganskiella cystojenkinii]